MPLRKQSLVNGSKLPPQESRKRRGKLKTSIRRKMIKTKAEINETKNRKTIEKNQWLFKRSLKLTIF